jgi:NDP-sugar pyrophosphorylase family protein
VKIDYGVIETGEASELARYIEKPEYHYLVSMGINVLEPRVLAHIGDDESLGIPDLMVRLKEAGERVVTFEPSCLWLDIGRPADHEKAVEIFEDLRPELTGDPPGP